MSAENKADVVIVGGGPVGLWTAIQIKKRKPHMAVQVYERYEEYKRSHVLKLEHFSTLIYGKRTGDARETEFFKEVTGKSVSEIFQQAATGSVFIRTNDLERALKSYAAAMGVNLSYKKIETPQEAQDLHPECKMFVAADGAHSNMRKILQGEDAVEHTPLQHVVEIKYQAKGRAGKLDGDESYRTNKLLSHLGFEYVGREKDGTTPVTLRFFVDKDTYKKLPEASFKAPLTLSDKRLPPSLVQDIQTYMNVRKDKAGEEFLEGSEKMSKLVLSLYAAKRFAVDAGEGKSWFFVGDAAMGVPYFRALNSGIIISSQLAYVLTRRVSNAVKIGLYESFRPFDVAWEFTAATGKDIGINAYDMFRRMSASVPSFLQFNKWSKKEAKNFRTDPHRAFRVGEDFEP